MRSYTGCMTRSYDKITMFGADWCGDCRRAKTLLDTAKIDYDYIDLVEHEDEAKTAEAISGRKNIPVIVFPDGSFLVEPSNDELVAKL